ncbi:MAG: (2Fe-2S)-binding protein [Gammaproteobacteria bacterium]|nr:MAG: (2Fe-2S)-binding protein [Gammaproteobacteria bacterium]
MKKLIRLNVNGDDHELAVSPDETLLGVLRGPLDLIGPKRGCDSGGCGCCTVQVDGKAVYSCMMYAVSAQGRDIITIEGIGRDGELDPLQQAFIDAGAVQCGYCTSGIIMVAKELLNTLDNPDEDEIRHAIAGNLCRCTGYQKIVDAIKLAAAAS